MDLHSTLAEALKSERDIASAQTIKLNFPTKEADDRIGNAKWERESKFKKMPDTHLVMSPAEGFFFHYNPDENAWFESNGSFVFIIGVARAKSRKQTRYWYRSSPYEIEKISHDKLGYGDINFRVDKKAKKIYLEKRWEGTRLRANTIDDPEAFRDAVKVAIREYPELKKYTFVPRKMKVEEYIGKGAAALEKGEEQKVYIGVLGDTLKEIKKEGLKLRETGKPIVQMFFDKKLAEKEAGRSQDRKKLYHVWATAEVTIKSEDEIGDKWGDGYEPGKTIPPERIKLLKTNMPKYFEEDWKPARRLKDMEGHDINKTRYGGKGRWSTIVVAKNNEEWEYFNNRMQREKRTKRMGRRKGPQTKATFNNFPEVVQLILTNGPEILLFKPRTSKEDVKRFMATEWLTQQAIWFEMPYDIRREAEFMRNVGYEVYFNKKVMEPLAKVMVTQSFEEGTWGIKAVRKFMTDMGFKVEGAED